MGNNKFTKQRMPIRTTKSTRPRKQTTSTLTSYSKEFKTFGNLIEELKGLHPEFSNIFTYEDNDSPSDAAFDVLKYFEHNNPDIDERTNLPVSISVSSNKVYLKTNKFFAFEWTFKYNKDGYTNLIATISTITKEQNHEDLDNMILKLNEKGWEIVTK